MNIPIIVANRKIDITVKDKIIIKEGFIDVLDIKNDLYIVDAKCINIKSSSKDEYKSGKVFLKGYIRNLIQYTVLDEIDNGRVVTTVRTLVNHIDFNCTTKVKYLVPVKTKKEKFHMKKFDSDEYKFENISKMNNLITYNLNKINIFCDINYYDYKCLKDSNNEKIFHGIQQNICSKLDLVLFQEQCVLL